MQSGDPVAFPLNAPLNILNSSFSLRGVSAADEGLRRERSSPIFSSETSIPGASPSMTTPTAGPWLSPKRVTQTLCPNVFFILDLLFPEQFLGSCLFEFKLPDRRNEYR